MGGLNELNLINWLKLPGVLKSRLPGSTDPFGRGASVS
jgi:hypothetical protein